MQDSKNVDHKKNDQDKEPKKYFYFIGNEKYESDIPELTGAQIKAKIADLEPNTGLSLEGHGNEPDEMIGDDQLVSLEKTQGPARFTLVPPATFG